MEKKGRLSYRNGQVIKKHYYIISEGVRVNFYELN